MMMPDAPISTAWLDPAVTDWEAILASDEAWPYLEEYRHLLARFANAGFRLRATCLASPIQLEGFLPTGEAMYLRCRHDTCALNLAPPDGDPIRAPTWTASVSRWQEEAAGSLSAAEIEQVLRELLARYHGTV